MGETVEAGVFGELVGQDAVVERLRAATSAAGSGHRAEKAAMGAAGWVLGGERRLDAAQRAAASARSLVPRHMPGPASAWTDTRDIPDIPEESFRSWWRREGAGEAAPRNGSPPRDGGEDGAADGGERGDRR